MMFVSVRWMRSDGPMLSHIVLSHPTMSYRTCQDSQALDRLRTAPARTHARFRAAWSRSWRRRRPRILRRGRPNGGVS